MLHQNPLPGLLLYLHVQKESILAFNTNSSLAMVNIKARVSVSLLKVQQKFKRILKGCPRHSIQFILVVLFNRSQSKVLWSIPFSSSSGSTDNTQSDKLPLSSTYSLCLSTKFRQQSSALKSLKQFEKNIAVSWYICFQFCLYNN